MTAAARLAVNVSGRNPHTGQVEVFRAGDAPPDWFAVSATNPDIWDATAAPAAGVARPPQVGRGSSRERWAEYADSVDVAYTSGDGRDEIVAAVAAAGR